MDQETKNDEQKPNKRKFINFAEKLGEQDVISAMKSDFAQNTGQGDQDDQNSSAWDKSILKDVIGMCNANTRSDLHKEDEKS